MAKKPASSPKSTTSPRSSSVKDSAQQIFTAGLGAIAKAQVESVKALESLVKDSAKIPQRTKAVAEEKLSEATHRVTHMASGQWDKLENIFEERVAKALTKLGVPSAKELSALVERLDALSKEVRALSQGKTSDDAPATARKPRSSTKAAAAPKPAATRARKSIP